MLRVALGLVLLLSAIAIAVPETLALTAKATPVSNDSTEVVTFPVLLQRVVDVDPSARTVRIVTAGGDVFRIPVDKLGYRIDPSEPSGRAEIHFIAASALPEERARVKSWDWRHAKSGRYRPKAGAQTVRPMLSCTLVFRSEVQYQEYLDGYLHPQLDGTIIRF